MAARLTQVSALRPTLFGTFSDYARRYCGARHVHGRWDTSGATNTSELHEKLKVGAVWRQVARNSAFTSLAQRIMIRRLKSEVLHELPPKRRCATRWTRACA